MTKANSPHPLSDLTEKIGKLTIAWNDLHFFVFSIFWQLNGNDAARSSAIFFSIQSDRTHRQVTVALAKVVLAIVPRLCESLIGLLEEVNKLSGRRNDVIHAMWAFDGNWQDGAASVFAPSSPRLSKKRLDEELDKLLRELLILRMKVAQSHTLIGEFLTIRGGGKVQPEAQPPQPTPGMATPAESNLLGALPTSPQTPGSSPE